MLCEQNTKTKSLQFLAALCAISLSSQAFARPMHTQNHHQKTLEVVYEQGQFFIVPEKTIMNTLKVQHDAQQPSHSIKTAVHSDGKNPAGSDVLTAHIYISINTTNQE
jgi:hypothetical protein